MSIETYLKGVSSELIVDLNENDKIMKSINHFKNSFCVAGRNTQNEKTLHADVLPAGLSL